MLRLAGALEAASEHPIARAVARAAAERFGVLPAGRGLRQRRGARRHRRRRRARGRRRPPPAAGRAGHRPARPSWSEPPPTAEADGRTAIAVGWDGAARGVLVVADAVKPTSADAVRQLRDLGLTPILLTGDNETVARAVAAEVGIDAGRRRGAAAGEGRRRPPAAGRGPDRGDGRRRRQRRRRARAGRPRAWPWAPAPTSPSRPATSRSCAATCGWPPTRSGCPAARWPPSRATCSGPSPTTSPRSRWPPRGCSTR